MSIVPPFAAEDTAAGGVNPGGLEQQPKLLSRSRRLPSGRGGRPTPQRAAQPRRWFDVVSHERRLQPAGGVVRATRDSRSLARALSARTPWAKSAPNDDPQLGLCDRVPSG